MADDAKQYALDKHKEWHGKIEVVSRASISTPEELAVAYTPGVAQPCLEIQKDVEDSYTYTRRGNLVAVVTDGSAVLGLGGKCALFKTFADVDAFPLCIRSHDVDEIVRTVELLAGSFGGVNLEDISAPRCFEIERRLKEVCDIPVFHDDREGLNPVKEEVASWTNREHVAGTLADAVRDADVFVGVSAPGALTQDMVRSMAKDAIVFACANPVPEIMPDEALAAGAAVAATGRSDFPNQINNVLAFPGIFRGALDVRASDINDDMMEAAAYAIAGLVDDEHRSAEYVIPGAFDQRVAPAVAAAVAEAARKSGVARL